MTRMKVEIKEPEPFSSLIKKKNDIEASIHIKSHHRALEPVSEVRYVIGYIICIIYDNVTWSR